MTRVERVAERIKQDVSEIIRERVADPRIGFVSVTEVDLSPDLKNASIYLSILGDEQKKKETMEAFSSAKGFIRSQLAATLNLRIMPEIRFARDDSIERGSRILGIISQLHTEHEERPVRKNKKSSKKR